MNLYALQSDRYVTIWRVFMQPLVTGFHSFFKYIFLSLVFHGRVSVDIMCFEYTNESFHEKDNSVDSALSIDPDQPEHAASLPEQTLFAYCGFSVSGIITLYFNHPETE